jgi:hypothetical protein
MRRLIVLLIGLVTMTVGGLVAGPAAATGGGNVLPPNSKPHGQSYAQWSAAWWQWSLALPTSTNPLLEQNGPTPVNVDCSAHQTGKVWYLVGVINVSGTAVRNCTVPPGTFLFFPVLNTECSNLEAPPFFGGNDRELRECALSFTFPNANAAIDGAPVANIDSFRVLSPPFNFLIPEDNVLGVNGPATGRSVSNGVYLMLSPLSVGRHAIHFGGGDPTGFSLDITYNITVIPPGHKA